MSGAASNAGSPPPGAPRKRVRGAVDTSLILEGERSRKRTSNAVELGGGIRAPGSPHPATLPAHDAEGYERVRQLGVELYDRMVSETDRYDNSRPLYLAFAELPNPQEYPDYYRMLKKPISFKEVKDKLDTLQYRSLPDVRTDINQIFVNAKRYNAPGSPIFMDAKRLHKVLKDAYAVMTGEVEPSRDDEPEAPEPVVEQPVSGGAAPTGGEDGRGDELRRATQLKPWLMKKLNETTNLYDGDGRRVADVFEKLPDRQMWPDYYQIITNPQSFSTVKYRVTHRYYATAAAFADDVNLIFANALYYNEESSGIAQDALRMKRHFADVMREQPPTYVPPREPKKPKKDAEARMRQKRQASAVPAAPEPEQVAEYDHAADDGMSDDGHSRHGSAAPEGMQQYAGARHDSEPQHGDAFPLQTSFGANQVDLSAFDSNNPLNGLAAASTGMFGASAASPALFQNPTTMGMLSGSPTLRTGAPLRYDTFGGQSNDGPKVPQHVARIPAAGEVPFVSRIAVTFSRTSPATPAPKPVVLDNATIRQHSLAVPAGVDRVEFVLHLANDRKGKGRVENGENGLQLASDDPTPQITACARPSSLALEELPPTTTVDASGTQQPVPDEFDLSVLAAGGGVPATRRYALTPRIGLSVVEFLVHPPAAVMGAADKPEEVFRLFLTR